MTDDERIALHRYRIAQLRAAITMEQTAIAAIRTGSAMRGLAHAFLTSVNREFADHPDIAYLDIQMDAFYGS